MKYFDTDFKDCCPNNSSRCDFDVPECRNHAEKCGNYKSFTEKCPKTCHNCIPEEPEGKGRSICKICLIYPSEVLMSCCHI